MPLTLSVLASSSSANCIFVASDTTAILIDAGLSVRQIEQRLAAIGRGLDAISGVCLSHEHSDHIGGVPVLCRRYGTAVYANAGTIEGARRAWKDFQPAWRVFETGRPFTIGDLTVEPFAVPHDAYDPVGFVIASGDARVGVATDLGMVTTLIRERLRGCHGLVLEANHDERMLRDSLRPWALKQRILGRQGHLSNRHAAEMLAEIAGPHLHCIVLAHVSAECNDPDLAAGEIRERLRGCGCAHVEVTVARPEAAGAVWRFPPRPEDPALARAD
jgi:phosphoribosyl 1,2-cyclic phosphodiesterase